MRFIINYISLALTFFLSLESGGQSQIKNQKRIVKFDDPEMAFLHPPESAKPGVLWMWMGCNLSKKGIHRDLEELKKTGFNRTTMFSLADVTTPWAGKIDNSPTPGIIAWTEPWWKLVRYAAEESKRLKMDFGMFNGAGYEASGGVWITPELSMQELCWSQTNLTGGRHIKVKIDKPEVDERGHSPYPMYNPATGLVEIPKIAARKIYYKDIALLAVPASGPVSKDSVVDLSGKMNSVGELDWQAPSGDWVIYRFGHTTSGTLMQPAQWEATGLECDKMDQQAVDFHMDHVITEIQRHLGALIGSGFTHVHFDSYEAGTPTWTPKMQSEFLARRGYDITPMLPVFAGRLIGGVQDSIKLKDDFDNTIKDLYRDIYFTTLSKKLKAANLIFLCEPYGGPWRQEEIMPLVGSVMTEFWTNKGVYSPYELKPTVDALRKSGKNIIEAEAFTGDPSDSKWNESPAWLKPIGDAAFCEGVNRLVLHRFVQQPWGDKYKPGATMGQWGTHFDRTQTWWKYFPAMVKYWQRCQALLQWGKIVLPDEKDFNLNDSSNTAIKYIHRTNGKTQIYFVANTSREKASATCTFNISQMQPELWDPVTSAIRKLTQYEEADGKISLHLDFDRSQSFFIVFRTKRLSTLKAAKSNFLRLKNVAEIEGSWKVLFDTKWGGPEKPVTFSSLQDWIERKETSIKYFSGTAVYNKSFDVPTSAMQEPQFNFYLDLGEVKHIAKVFLNNADLGVIWTAPWMVKISKGLLKNKNNQLIIEVTNVWANRLIGDEQQPADVEWLPGHMGGRFLKKFPTWFLNDEPRPSKKRYCFTTWNYFTKESSLIPSGLLGPVRILKEE